MRVRYRGLAIVLTGVLAHPPGYAADPAPQAAIHGQDVMGDKGRTGPDGWSWAPVARDKAPANPAPGTSAVSSGSHSTTQPGPNEGKMLPPGEDPGTPAATEGHGPGTMDTAAKPKP